METFVVAGGRLDLLDAAFRALRGVIGVAHGRAGGADAVAVTFDPDAIPAEIVLAAFFTMHDPCLLEGQDAAGNAPHRSALFPADDEQRRRFERARDRAMQWWDGLVVTTIEPGSSFERAGRSPFAAIPAGKADAGSVVARVRARFADFALGG